MFTTQLKTATAILLVVVVLAGGRALTAGQPEPKKDDAAKTQDKKPADKLVPKVEKKEPAKTETDKKPDAVATLKERLKKHEDEIARIRQAMVKEIDQEIEKLDTAMKEAKKAQKTGDREALRKSAQLTSELVRLKSMRFQIEHGINAGGSVKKPKGPVEAQMGLHLSAPGAALREQLGLKKDQGLILDKVSADSLAAKAGLHAHDILIQVDGKAISSEVSALRKVLTALPAGAAVDVVVVRKGKQETIKGLIVPPSSK